MTDFIEINILENGEKAIWCRTRVSPFLGAREAECKSPPNCFQPLRRLHMKNTLIVAALITLSGAAHGQANVQQPSSSPTNPNAGLLIGNGSNGAAGSSSGGGNGGLLWGNGGSDGNGATDGNGNPQRSGNSATSGNPGNGDNGGTDATDGNGNPQRSGSSENGGEVGTVARNGNAGNGENRRNGRR